ncbi:hypothetical protein [Calothrix sp. UHCC 0171]|uniref:hypothetical protein n=1 Tax=Calothrix sp. UHCC 0171 TaxID=3110245 RepID=UPI002B20E392|nr:hypothetical protein [Calothrix sp. UHCC 0171]MEA5571278.1 hypothetical protein [Calothrix sp. UHCC 0171]
MQFSHLPNVLHGIVYTVLVLISRNDTEFPRRSLTPLTGSQKCKHFKSIIQTQYFVGILKLALTIKWIQLTQGRTDLQASVLEIS